MNAITAAERFLNALAALDRNDGKGRGPAPFVTISRETGAGGHTLAKALLWEIGERKDRLGEGWQILDRELCRQVLENPKIRASMQSLVDELYLTPTEDWLRGLISGSSAQPAVLGETFKIIRAAAARGRVIVVGRGAASLTRDLPGGLHVRLVAPAAVRTKRMMALESVSEAAAARIIQERDRDRARLVRDYFKKDVTDPLLYHAVWNTGLLPEKDIAQALARLLEARARVL